jgi:TPR repeat protein
VRLYRMAVELGDASAGLRLATCLGYGVDKDQREVGYYRMAADGAATERSTSLVYVTTTVRASRNTPVKPRGGFSVLRNRDSHKRSRPVEFARSAGSARTAARLASTRRSQVQARLRNSSDSRHANLSILRRV